MDLQQNDLDKIDDILNLSRAEKYQDMTIFCKNGIFQANSLLLSTIFPVLKSYSVNSFLSKTEASMISIPDLETRELEILFHGIHQQAATIQVGPVLQKLLLLQNFNPSKDILEETSDDNEDDGDPPLVMETIPDKSDGILELQDKDDFKCDDNSLEFFELVEHEIEDIEETNEKVELRCDDDIDNNDGTHEYFSLAEPDNTGIIDKVDIKYDIVDPVVIQIKNNADSRRIENNLESPKENTSKSHSRPYIYPCRFDCGKISNDLSNRNSHERKIHGKVFETRKERNNRLKKEKKIPIDIDIDCEFCGKHFENKAKYKLHLYNHGTKIACKVCGKAYVKNTLRIHMRDAHKQNISFRPERKYDEVPKGLEDEEVPCFECGKLVRRKHMKSHRVAQHENKKCPKCSINIKVTEFDQHHCNPVAMVCNICGKSFKNEVRLNRHVSAIHDKNDKDPNLGKYYCDICGRTLKTETHLKLHKYNVHENETCPHCGYTGRRNQVKYHIEQNHMERKIKCSDCDKEFISKKKLEQHTMNVHIKAYPYHCRYDCGMKYNDPSNRNCHERKKHGKVFEKKKLSGGRVETENTV